MNSLPSKELVSQIAGPDYAELYEVCGRFKGCPFCGRQPETYVAAGGFAARCHNEDCFNFSVLHRDVNELLKRWNRRTE